MKTVKVGYDTIHDIVDNSNNAFWDGWKAIFVKPISSAAAVKNAIRHNGRWHIVLLESEPDSHGLWEVPINV